jgi:hypothetical protein
MLINMIRIIKENELHQFSFYKKGEIYEISFTFEEYHVGVQKGIYAKNAIAILKTDCEVI